MQKRSLVFRIAKQPIVRPLYILVSLGAKVRWPLLVAAGWYLLTVRTRQYGNAKQKKRILALPKSGGPEDLYASLEALGDRNIEVWTLVRKSVTNVAEAFLPPAVMTDYVYVSSDPKVEEAKKQYREFLKEVWRLYGKWRGISAVIGFSIFYSAERELAVAVEELGTPFLILFKEGAKSVAEHKRDEQAYRFRLGSTGRAISVYNQEEKDAIVRSGFAPEDRVVVTGCPRIDSLHDSRRNGSKATEPGLVLLFSFSPTVGVGLPWVENEWWGDRITPAVPEPFHWNELARATHLAMIRLARKRPDLRFLIKVKVGKENEDFIDEVLPSDLPGNIAVVKRGLGDALAERASIVVGFNSTAILSAIAAAKPVVVPRFAEALLPGAEHCMFDYGEAVSWAHSPEELMEFVEEKKSRLYSVPLELSVAAKEVLARYVGNPDGKAGERMGAFLLRHLQL